MKPKKLIACLLAAAISFSAFAPTAQATEVTTEAPATTQSITPAEAETLTPNASDYPSYTVTFGAGQKEFIQEITMDHAGYIYIPMSIMGTDKGISVYLYSDAACTAKLGYSSYLSSSSLTATQKAPIPAAGTYYLQFSSYSEMTADVPITLTPYCYNSDTRKIEAKEDVYSYNDSSNIIYHEIKISKTGYINVTAESANNIGSLYVTLFDSKKKALSNSIYLSNTNGNETCFAVKKGTYYIGTKCYSDAIHLKYTFTSVSEKSGSSKKKAVTIKAGKTVKGLIQATDSTKKYDYYKIKLTKKQKVSLICTAKSCESIKFTVIPASSKLTIWGDSVLIYDNDKKSWTTQDKLPTGTYYIKVEKINPNSSGYYSIKFNK